MKTDCTDYDDGIRSAGSDFCEEYIPFSEAEIRMFGSTFGTADPECGSGCLGDADFPGIPEVIPGAGRSGSLRRPARKPFPAPEYGNPARDDNRSRVYLNVPYSEKDAARGYGARWDAARRKWYVPDGTDLEPFQRWLDPR